MGQLPAESRARGVSCESSTSVRSTSNLPSAAASPASFQTAASTSALDQCGPRQRTSSFSERPNEVRQILMCFPLKHVVDAVRSAQISHQMVGSRTRRTRISTLVEVNMGMVFEKQSQMLL